MTAFQQTCREEPTYRADLRMLQYDALYGKGYCYEGEARYRPTEMEMGMVPIEITGMEQRAGDWFILGENFTPYCVVTQNGQLLDTEYEAPWALPGDGGAEHRGLPGIWRSAWWISTMRF